MVLKDMILFERIMRTRIQMLMVHLEDVKQLVTKHVQPTVTQKPVTLRQAYITAQADVINVYVQFYKNK